jgi:hypothetical protein
MVLYIIFALIVLGTALVFFEIGKKHEHTKNEWRLSNLEQKFKERDAAFDRLLKMAEDLKHENFNDRYQEFYKGYVIDVYWKKGNGFKARLYDPEFPNTTMPEHFSFIGIDKKDLIAKCKRHIDGLKTMEQ